MAVRKRANELWKWQRSELRMTFLPIVERELIEASRRRNTYWLRIGVAAAGVAIGCWVMLIPEFRTPSRLGMALFVPLAIVALLYCGLIGVFRTADCLSEEKREGTLGLLFLTDLKGHDIVFGKLVATSVNTAYALLALFPILAIPLLAGGVAFNEFARVVVVCVNSLFFSLAVGMFCSAVNRDERHAMVWAVGLILAYVAGWPMLGAMVERATRARHSGLMELFFLPSPAFSAVYAFEDVRRGQSSAGYFWISVGLVHVASWLFLVAASVIVPRTWQDRPLSEAALRRRQRLQELGAAPADHRRTRRHRLLGLNPILWLVTRGRFKAAAVWGVLAVGAVIWIIGLMTYPRDWLDEAMYMISAIVTHTVIKAWVVTEACRRFSLDRQSGALELLLSTPLSVREIVRGQWLGIERVFGGPVILVLLVDLVFLASGRGERGWVPICVAGMAIFLVDLVALTWLGMWRGLNSRRPNRAAAAALVRILIVPWVTIGLLFTVLGVSGLLDRVRFRAIEDYGFALVYFCVSLALDFAFAWPARRGLLTRFRTVATERFATRSAGS